MNLHDSKLIVVLGATGTQGGGVIREFLKHSEWCVRAVTRDITSTKARDLAKLSPNVALVTADMNDVESLRRAFAGAQAIFAVTDFWTLYNDPANSLKTKPGQDLIEWCFDAELQQGKNIFDAAAETVTLTRLVFSNLPKCSKWSRGKYNYVLHSESKAAAVDYLESAHPILNTKTSKVQVGFYLENFVNHTWAKPHQDTDGCIVFRAPEFEYFSSVDVDWPLVAAGPDTGKVVYAFVEKLPPCQHVVAHRKIGSLSKFVEIFSTVTRRPAKLKFDTEITQHASASLRREMEENFAFCREFGYWGYDDGTVRRLDELGVEFHIGSVEEWIKDQDWDTVLRP